MKLTFYGAAKEVGRSCIVLDDRYMLDAGIDLDHEIRYPTITDLSQIKAIFVCHAHLDHSGALPLFNHQGLNVPIFCTSMTKKLAYILLKDEFKIQKLQREHPAYNKSNITNVMASVKYVSPRIARQFDDIDFTYYLAGHIPGSCCIMIETEGRSLLYTSDIGFMDTLLMNKCDELPHADVMITESTYGQREHPDRKETEKIFLEKVRETLERGGSVLIPVFAVGRAQEIILLLDRLETNAPIYLDGMAEDVTRIILEEPAWIRNGAALRKAFQRVRLVKHEQRSDIARSQSVIVTTSGMMEGGPVISYIRYMHDNPKNSVLLTGFQGINTNGRRLMEQGIVDLEGEIVSVKCEKMQFDFSAHSGRKELIELIRKVDPEVLIVQHGDPPAVESLASEFPDKKVYIPELGDTIQV
jgi:putative mRNA 3-end processing factor